MSLQSVRLQTLCEQLELNGILSSYSTIAQNAANNQHTFTDFLEHILEEERSIRALKGRAMLLKTAGLPSACRLFL